MARTINESSTRQQAFEYLDGELHTPRGVAVDALIEQFGVGKAYAKTLYQNHRKDKIATGVLVKVFSVRDMKDGKVIEPVLVSRFVPQQSVVETHESTKAKHAVQLYKAMLRDRISVATTLA